MSVSVCGVVRVSRHTEKGITTHLRERPLDPWTSGPLDLTSSNREPSLQDADVELQRELGGRSQEGLDDRGARKGRPVREQLPLRLPHLPLHLLGMTPAGHLLLPGDADIRLLHAAHAAVDTERLQTPETAQR